MPSLLDQITSTARLVGDTISQVSKHGLSRPPQVVVDQIAAIASNAGVKKQLAEFGKAVGELIWAKAVYTAASDRKAPAPVNPWITQVIMPVLDPIIVGVQTSISAKVRTVGIIVGIGATVTHASVYMLGRAMGRRDR